MQPRVVGPPLAAGHARSVVAPVEDDRVLLQTVLSELVEHRPGQGVHLGQLVVVLRPVPAAFRRVGVVGRHAHGRSVMDCFVGAGADPRFVRDGEVEDREERLPGGPLAPVSLTAGLVPDLAGFLEIVVLLGVVRRVIACVPEILRKHLQRRRQAGQGAHVLRPRGRRVHAADDRGPCRGAHGGGGPGGAVDHPPAADGVEVRSGRIGVPVHPEVRSVVLGAEPQNVRLSGDGRQAGGSDEEQELDRHVPRV